jgi:hypothetical protein
LGFVGSLHLEEKVAKKMVMALGKEGTDLCVIGKIYIRRI